MIDSQRFIQIDRDGYIHSLGAKAPEQEMGFQILQNLIMDSSHCYRSSVNGDSFIVEAFDEPLIVQHLTPPKSESDSWTATCQYQFTAPFSLDSLSLDEWDRFHGLTDKNISFVFSDEAQNDLFDVLDSFTDTSITFKGTTLEVPHWLNENLNTKKEEFWTNIYNTETPGWELEKPSPLLESTLPQIKLPKSKILVLGCGSANDAALFAQSGHLVTAVDISPKAIEEAQKKYGNIPNLKLVQGDAFSLPNESLNSFDVIFEHTFYCAITPSRRNELIRLWWDLLRDDGRILGIFFATEGAKSGPPFGGSEFELKKRLSPLFNLLYWTRARNSIEKRMGKELIVFAQKKDRP